MTAAIHNYAARQWTASLSGPYDPDYAMHSDTVLD
jgi:hypothetical protein